MADQSDREEIYQKLAEYRGTLRGQIQHPRTNMLLHASEVYDDEGLRLGVYDSDKRLLAFEDARPVGIYHQYRGLERFTSDGESGGLDAKEVIAYTGEGVRLGKYLADGEIIAEIDDYYDRLKNAPELNDQLARAAFQLVSGRYQREFITLWELFDHPEIARDCMQNLATRARLIREKSPYDGIITCTPTGDLLMERIHADLEKDLGVAKLQYLGNFPFINPFDKKIFDFKGQDVLIMSDVVASGSLVQTLAEQVAIAGGRAVAALCVAVIDEARIDSIQSSATDTTSIKFTTSTGPQVIDLYSLTDVEIEKSASKPTGMVRKIDPITVLPLDENDRSPVDSLIGPEQMLSHFENADALSVGFFEKQNYFFTAAVRIERLLKKFGDEIWKSIVASSKIRELKFLDASRFHPKPLVLVTTYDRDDLAFQRFVATQLDAENIQYEILLVPQRESLESDNSFFVPRRLIRKLVDSEVLLIQGTAATGHRFKAVVALLVSYGVRSVDSLCLINKMGTGTTDFTKRIKTLMRRSHDEAKSDEAKRDELEAPFTFTPIYSLADLRPSDVAQVLQFFHILFDYYHEKSKVASFQAYAKVEQNKYFRAQLLSSASFTLGSSRTLNSIGDQGSTRALTRDGRLWQYARDFIRNPDRSKLIVQLNEVRDKETLYRTYCILMAEVNYLQMTNQVSIVRETLRNGISRSRQEWLSLSSGLLLNRMYQDEQDEAISGGQPDAIQLETNLCFGLGVFAYVDHETVDESFLKQRFEIDLDGSDYAYNLLRVIAYFSDERVVWSLSWLLRLAMPNMEKKESFLKELSVILRGHLSLIESHEGILDFGDDKQAERVKERTSSAIANINLLRTELGEHKQQEVHELIRYLHSMLLITRTQHSPIVTSIRVVSHRLEYAINKNIYDENEFIPKAKVIIIKPDDDRLKNALYEALHHIGLLHRIAKAVKKYLKKLKDVALPAEETEYLGDPLKHDINGLMGIVSSIREQNRFTRKDVEEIELYKRRIESLWHPKSGLHISLTRYIVSLQEIMRQASQDVNNHSVRGVLETCLSQLAIENWYFLCDPAFAHEMLKNIITNARHNSNESEIDDLQISCELLQGVIFEGDSEESVGVPELDHDTGKDYIKLTFISRGNIPFNKAEFEAKKLSTFKRHQKEIRAYRGRLEISAAAPSEKPGTEVTLYLLKRNAIK